MDGGQEGELAHIWLVSAVYHEDILSSSFAF